MKARFLVPLGVFAAMVALLGVGLTMNPREVPSPLIGKPMPAFDLALLNDPEARLTDRHLRGRVSVLNVWGTWCVGCREEHDVLLRLASAGVAPIYGLNWKDDRVLALRWLSELGDPYVATGFDHDGKAAIDWGVYGAPETFVLDARGTVRYKHIGVLTDALVERELLPLLRALKAESS